MKRGGDIKIAVVQLDAVLADVTSNMKQVETYIREASEKNVELILFPEFFTSSMGFSEKMLDVPLQNFQSLRLLKEWSHQYNIIIGGSNIVFDGHESYNRFDLIFPNSEVFSHRKDIPTQYENCYFTKGDEAHILKTPIGDIGIALCWEMLRYDTIKRLSEKVDIVFAGSCWWDLPEDAPVERDELRQYNQNLALDTPVTFAKLLHVPVIHANHCGKITTYDFPNKNKLQTRQLVGSAQIVSARGDVVARRKYNEGEGMIVEEVAWGNQIPLPAIVETNKYWIPDLPESYINAWETYNPLGEEYYKNIALPYYRKNYPE